MGKTPRDIFGAQLSQSPYHNGGACDTIHVPVAENEDFLLFLTILLIQGFLYPFHSCIDIVHSEGTMLV